MSGKGQCESEEEHPGHDLHGEAQGENVEARGGAPEGGKAEVDQEADCQQGGGDLQGDEENLPG